MAKELVPWIPDHIVSLLEEWGWVAEGVWVDGQRARLARVAVDICTSLDSKKAWKFFKRKDELVMNDYHYGADHPGYADCCNLASQNAFKNYLRFGYMTLYEWEDWPTRRGDGELYLDSDGQQVLNPGFKRQIMTSNRLKAIQNAANELIKLLDGVEHHLGREFLSVKSIAEWAETYPSLGFANFRDEEKTQLRWFAVLMTGENKPQSAQALANLTNFLFRETGLELSKKDIENLKPHQN